MVTGERHPVFVSLDVFQMGSRRVRDICFSLLTGQRQLVYVSLHVCFEWSQVDLAVLQARVQRKGRTADLGNLLGPLPDRLLPLVSVRGHRGHLWG